MGRMAGPQGKKMVSGGHVEGSLVVRVLTCINDPCMRARDPWVLPIEAEARRRAAAAKRALAEAAGGASDHLALVCGGTPKTLQAL